ncbi:MAG: hypothetical protein HN494_11830 [Opitutae bacterium]|nr:hypothetical protein [Opitutae bacterium]MBT5908667.1 hypothetical protein [Opitutae bacterium]MBT6850403.1 hypothetical protein [Opitutae bacterium]MBT7742613.1 hypothetical protein [Opitutae bacterium]
MREIQDKGFYIETFFFALPLCHCEERSDAAIQRNPLASSASPGISHNASGWIAVSSLRDLPRNDRESAWIATP